ncbi:DUF5711 family protein [Bengtsoniella intestinalis]|uniref:DUF5711 family protein n=1 Tax=Bengtsoniella intestinalis TaxID=3073143 RepID=UPI00391F8BE6
MKMNDSMDETTKEPKRDYGRIFGIIAIIVITVVVVAAYRDGTGFDAVNRFFSYTIGDDSTAYQYDDGTQTQFVLLGDTLVALSKTKVEVQSFGGELLFTELCYMQNPSLEVGTNHAVAYDVGGDDYYVFDANGLVYQGVIEGGASLVSATLNHSDYLTLTHESSGYKTTTSVYDAKSNLIYSFNSATRFVLEGYVSDDNTTLIAVALGADGTDFVSQLLYYPLTDTQMSHSANLSGVLPLEVGQQGDNLVLLGDTELSYVNMDGDLVAQYDFDGEYLRGYDCTTSQFSVILLNRYQAGNEGRLVTLDSSGTELGSLSINEEVMDITISGNYIAVLYSEKLVIYTSELSMYATIGGLDYASHALMQSDGSVVIFGRERAEIVAP